MAGNVINHTCVQVINTQSYPEEKVPPDQWNLITYQFLMPLHDAEPLTP